MVKHTSDKYYNCIKEVLEAQGKSQTWLAQQLDLDFRTVARYVNNHRQPTIERLYEIANVLKVDARSLLIVNAAT